MFVINLDRARDRWESTSRQMKQHGLIVERIPAVDGRTLTKDDLRLVSTRIAAFLQPRGVIGCYLSHRKFWQMVVDRNLDSAIIFEDDIQLVDDFKTKLIMNLRSMNQSEPYDVLFLGAIGRVHPEGKDGLGPRIFSTYFGGKRPVKKISDNVYQPIRPAGTHAYMVTNAGARKLLQLCPKAVFHVDLDAWRHQSLIVRIFYPMLVFQTFESTTLTEVSTDRKGFNKWLVSTQVYRRFEKWATDPITHQPVSIVVIVVNLS